MPELPEMRALAERLEARLQGAALENFRAYSFSFLKTVQPTPEALVGSTVAALHSRGKYLVWSFGNDLRTLVHLGNAGRLDLETPPKATKPKGALARFVFGSQAVLIREHGSERRAGVWVLGPGDDGVLAALGPEPFEEGFAELIANSGDRRHLHTLLRDQHSVAGIGRGYADDALNRAGLSPFATLAGLDTAGRTRLLDAVRSVLAEALDAERQRVGGLSETSLGDRFLVHRRAGSPCPRCGRRLERVAFESHEIVYCPTCQTAGQVLADRRLSRLLR